MKTSNKDLAISHYPNANPNIWTTLIKCSVSITVNRLFKGNKLFTKIEAQKESKKERIKWAIYERE